MGFGQRGNEELLKRKLPALKKSVELNSFEKVLIKGDLAPLTENQRVAYVNALCKAIGVSALFQPFDYISFQGKLVIYAKRSCAEQLRFRRKISIKITNRERIDGLYVVTAQAKDKEGREDEAIGAVNIKGLGGKDLENALMRAETKAKRRVTLSICGLGIIDEIEAEDLARKEAKIEAELAAEAVETKLDQTPERPALENERPDSSVSLGAPPNRELEYKLKTVRGAKGKGISGLPVQRLKDWLKFYDQTAAKGGGINPEVQDDAFHIRAYLDGLEMDSTATALYVDKGSSHDE